MYLSFIAVTMLALRSQKLTKVHLHKIKNRLDIIYRTYLKLIVPQKFPIKREQSYARMNYAEREEIQ